MLIVFSDDQRFDSTSATGNPHIKTPSLDRIADEGVVFERAYVVSSRCCPGRATLLTGQYPTRHGVWSNKPDAPFPGDAPTMADAFQAAGYRTAWVGKWHLPNPGARPVRGFDHFVSYEGPGSHFDQELTVNGTPEPSVGFQADRLKDHAIAFLDRTEGRFFLVLAFKNPHVPMTPAPRHHRMLDDVTFPMPISANDELPAFYAGLREDSRHAITPAEFAETEPRYWELVLSIDDNVGDVLDHLEGAGRLDNTIVLATTDNGQLRGEHGLIQKGLSYEPSIRVPLAMRYPAAIPTGTRTQRMALNVDVYPTLAALTGIALAGQTDGLDLAPLWKGEDEDEDWRDEFLYMAPSFGQGAVVERALVEERWKYIHVVNDPHEEEILFDRAADPDERVNLVGEPQHQAELERMRATTLRLRAGLGDG
ncbi:MAG: sulfatase-like hydrolase/transferase [Planctomycetota bacterium]|nr:sulfatase-like hydrolase/transferase [Planctomycetota bacterium]